MNTPLPEGPSYHAILPAAGRGERFGAAQPKQTLEIEGAPLLAWAVKAVQQSGCLSLVIALPEEWLAWGRDLFFGQGVEVVVGGKTRQESVFRALEVCPACGDELVLVHDGARPALASSDLAAVVAAAARCGAAVLARPLQDTVKRRLPGGRLETLNRSELFAAETPQVFRRELLERAFALAAREARVATDEASLVEALGVAIELVEAQAPNPKLTTPQDLPWVTWLLKGRAPRGSSAS